MKIPPGLDKLLFGDNEKSAKLNRLKLKAVIYLSAAFAATLIGGMVFAFLFSGR